MQKDVVRKEHAQSWREEVKREIEKTITPEYIAKTHRGLMKSKNHNVRLGAVKMAYDVMGVGATPPQARPLIILSTSGFTPPSSTLEGLEGVDVIDLGGLPSTTTP